MQEKINISRSDVLWNYLSTFLKLTSAIILLPIVLRVMHSETVGIWTIFIMVTTFSNLLDFGFTPTFTRNVTYVFSGVRRLKANGFDNTGSGNQTDYGLLKGLIASMKMIYFRLSVGLLVILATFGTFYIISILKSYSGNHTEVYIAWTILILINSYNIYTSYFEALLLGRGLVKRSKQIVSLAQMVYISLAVSLVIAGFGLVAIVAAQAVSVLINRFLSYRSFFDLKTTENLNIAHIASDKSEILKAIYPNSVKIGITSLGGFLIQRSAVIIGSFYLTLNEIASYGITIQIVTILSGIAGIYTNTFLPRITSLRISNNSEEIRRVYTNGQVILLITFIFGGIAILTLAQPALDLIKSQTNLMSFGLTLFTLILLLEQTNLIMAGSILLTRNEVPFYRSSIVSGIAIVLIMLLMFEFTTLGQWNLILVPLLVDLAYQSWKWPYKVIKELNIRISDFRHSIFYFSGKFESYFKK